MQEHNKNHNQQTYGGATASQTNYTVGNKKGL